MGFRILIGTVVKRRGITAVDRIDPSVYNEITEKIVPRNSANFSYKHKRTTVFIRALK